MYEEKVTVIKLEINFVDGRVTSQSLAEIRWSAIDELSRKRGDEAVMERKKRQKK